MNRIFGLLLSGAALVIGFAASFQPQLPPKNRGAGTTCYMSSQTASGGAPVLCSTLKKPSKVLTVGVEYCGTSLSSTELSIESMQLRKSKVSAIWCQDVTSLREIASAEQESARGDFPGPCPVIFHGPIEEAGDAVQAGASAIVLSPTDTLPSLEGCEVVWKAESVEDVATILENTQQEANVFFLDDIVVANLDEILNEIPKNALCIAAVNPMQADGAEIEEAKKYKAQGVGSILVKRACIGDEEDLEYAQFLVGGMTSKASSEFKFSGLTGSTNGHFGGVQANSSVNWRRPNSS